MSKRYGKRSDKKMRELEKKLSDLQKLCDSLTEENADLYEEAESLRHDLIYLRGGDRSEEDKPECKLSVDDWLSPLIRGGVRKMAMEFDI